MPHAGQRKPNIIWDEHGGNPNCWCVPKPAESGSSIRAVTNSAISNMPPVTITARSHQSNGHANGAGSTAVVAAGNLTGDSVVIARSLSLAQGARSILVARLGAANQP